VISAKKLYKIFFIIINFKINRYSTFVNWYVILAGATPQGD
jgi:hypothetical protein